MSANTPFNAGPRLSDPPKGDPSTEAIAALRGYSYQLYASGIAWSQLSDGQDLYLEVARDYAIATAHALNMVEVKDTPSSKMTIRSAYVRDALEAFVDLVERNPERKVTLRVLSTSAIGQERQTADRVNGASSLVYWRRAAAGADVAPLRAVLKRLSVSPKVHAFIGLRDDDALRNELLRCIHWDCGQPSLEDIARELRIALARSGSERLGTHADDNDRMLSGVMQHLLHAIVGTQSRRLTDADLLDVLSRATSVTLGRRDFNKLIQSLADRATDASQSARLDAASISRVLEPETEVPLPEVLADRSTLVSKVSQLVRGVGVAFVSGSTGSGKTLLARLSARHVGGQWYLVDFRVLDAPTAAQRLQSVLDALPASGAVGIILDDFNELEDAEARQALRRFLNALRRRDMLCIATAYRSPSARALTELGISGDAAFTVPSLTIDEIGLMIASAGGDGEGWRQVVHVGSGFGHPQLAQAIISNVRSRAWSKDELRRLQAHTPSPDVEQERQAVRRRLVAEMPEDASMLLYRTSLLVGRFDRDIVLKLGGISPAVKNPGSQLDLLIGPWIEQMSECEMRMSALLQGAGRAVLTPSDQVTVHRVTAEILTVGSSLDVTKADVMFLHALLGKSVSSLAKLSYGVIRCNAEDRERLAEWMTGLRAHRLDRPIYPDHPSLSLLLRLAQFLLVASQGNPKAVSDCWRAFQRELGEERAAKVRQQLEYMALAKILLEKGTSGLLPDWIDLILRFVKLAQSDTKLGPKFLKQDWGGADDDPKDSTTLIGVMFTAQLLGLPGVSELAAAFAQLHALRAEQRATLFADLLKRPGDFGLVVNHAWHAQAKRGVKTNWVECAESYRLMAQQALSWGYRELSLRCHVAEAIVLDEYASNSKSAEEAMDRAVGLLGEEPVLSRERAKILYRRQDHEGALKLLRQAAPSISHPIDRAYMLREAGISAGETGKWSESQEWFIAARDSAAKLQIPAMKIMAIGLTADSGLAAFKAGRTEEALVALNSALDRLTELDPEGSVSSGYCHRVVRHAVLWLFGQGTQEQLEVDGQPATMIPGMCSNPEPTDVKDLPLASLDYARYMLAQTELELGVDAGIAAGLRAALGDRAIPAMEILLRHAQVCHAIRRLDVDGFLASLPGWVDSQIYLKAHGQDIRNQGPLRPVYGEIIRASEEDLKSPGGVFHAEDALQSFGIAAALRSRPDALVQLHARYNREQAGSELTLALATGASTAGGDRIMVARATNLLAGRADPTPEELFVCTVRFVQAANASNFRKFLVRELTPWVRSRWQYVTQNQRFYLRNPSVTVAPIEEALNAQTGGMKYLGRLILAVEPAVSSRLDRKTREFMLSLEP